MIGEMLRFCYFYPS